MGWGRSASRPDAARLLITADAGGGNGYRMRAWKKELADLARDTNLQTTVSLPARNLQMEQDRETSVLQDRHELARPLTSHEVVNKIGATTTHTGLTVHAELDSGTIRLTVPNEVMAALPLSAHAWHGQWTYTPTPAPERPVSTPATRYVDRA